MVSANRYQYLAVYNLGGLSPPDSHEERVILEYPDVNAKARIVLDVDSCLTEIDRKSAVGYLMLANFFGGAKEGTIEEQIAERVAATRSARTERIKSGVTIVFEASGELDQFEWRNHRERPEFFAAFGGPSKDEIRAKYSDLIDGLLTSFVLASETVHELTKIADDVIFVSEDDKPIYAFNLILPPPKVTVSRILKPDVTDVVSETAQLLSTSKGLSDPARLLIRSMQDDIDDVLAFLSAWAGLEIFVNQNFREYDLAAFDRFTGPDKFIGKIKEVMGGKYRLQDRFSLISFELTTTNDPAEDESTFKQLNELRNDLTHKGQVESLRTSVEKAQNLLRKYLNLRLERIMASANDVD